jgi:hypothetical protein
MTAERARAYGRVMRTLRDLGPPKLLAPEQARIRRMLDLRPGLFIVFARA